MAAKISSSMRNIYRIISLLPAQQDTFALFCYEAPPPDSTELLKAVYKPVVGWALADCWCVDRQDPRYNDNPPQGPGLRVVVPLVVDFGGHAEPVDTESSDFLGIRVGKYVSTMLCTGWIDDDQHDPYVLWDHKNECWEPRQSDRERTQKRDLLRKQFLFLMHEESHRLGMLVGADIGSVADRLALLAVPEPTAEAPKGTDHG